MKKQLKWGGLCLFGAAAGDETEPLPAIPATNGAAVAPSGEEGAPAAGEQTDPTARKETFRKMMEGEYKDLFTAYFQETFNRRFREQKGMKEELEAARAVVEAAAARYGTTDTERLSAAIRAETLPEAPAETAGRPPVPAAPPISEADVRLAAEREIVAAIRARGLRPAEGALSANGRHGIGAVTHLSRAQRAEVARRAAKGEYIEL